MFHIFSIIVNYYLVVYLGFGAVILYINKNLLNSKQNLKRVFATAGVVSLVVGSNMLLG